MDFYKPLILRYVGHSDAALSAPGNSGIVIPDNLVIGCHELFVFPPQSFFLTGAEKDTLTVLSILGAITKGHMSTGEIARYIGRTDRTALRRLVQVRQRGFLRYLLGTGWQYGLTPFEEKFKEMLRELKEPEMPYSDDEFRQALNVLGETISELGIVVPVALFPGRNKGCHAWVRASDYIRFRYFLRKP